MKLSPTASEFDETADDDGPLIKRRPVPMDLDLDITPMIDITFLLLIFFLVASIPDPSTSVDLPSARHGGGVRAATSIVVTVAEGGGGGALGFLSDGKTSTALPENPAQQEEEIGKAVEEGIRSGKTDSLIKAERGVRHKDVSRVAAAASKNQDIALHLAVMEIE